MQSLDGLGIAAQKDAVLGYVEKQNGEMLGQFSEVESGAKNDRPQLTAALALCKKTKAILLVARLDRLSRDAAFLISLQKSEVTFCCVDTPECDKFTVSLFAILAQRERELIGQRTRLALQAAKKRGVVLGTKTPDRQVRLMCAASTQAKEEFQEKVRPIVREIQNAGCTTLQEIANCLNARGVSTRRNGGKWHPATVKRVMA